MYLIHNAYGYCQNTVLLLRHSTGCRALALLTAVAVTALCHVSVLVQQATAQQSTTQQATIQHEEHSWYVGVYVSYDEYLHQANFKSLNARLASAAPENFGLQRGVNGSFGVSAEYGWSQMFRFMGRVGIGSMSTNFSQPHLGGADVLTSSGLSTTRELVYVLSPRIWTLDVELGARIHPVSVMPTVFIDAGVRGSAFLNARLEQREELSHFVPFGVVFPNGSRVRNVQEAEIAAMKPLALWTYMGLGLDMPLFPTVRVQPALRYYLPLTDVNTAVPWRVSSLRISGDISVTLRQ